MSSPPRFRGRRSQDRSVFSADDAIWSQITRAKGGPTDLIIPGVDYARTWGTYILLNVVKDQVYWVHSDSGHIAYVWSQRVNERSIDSISVTLITEGFSGPGLPAGVETCPVLSWNHCPV